MDSPEVVRLRESNRRLRDLLGKIQTHLDDNKLAATYKRLRTLDDRHK